MQFKIIKNKEEKFFIFDTWQNLYFNNWIYWQREIIDYRHPEAGEIGYGEKDYEEEKGANYVRCADDSSNWNINEAQEILRELFKYGGKYGDEKLNHHNYILIPCCRVKFKSIN